ncbi:MAG: DUF58 domain-containing protein [Ignisphaera sp.]|uniref:DUF58 domain-containing protein n=1 Tax=Ignisphaera aggregans TaxID=334771 RepID=A0A7J3N015_9CREN
MQKEEVKLYQVIDSFVVLYAIVSILYLTFNVGIIIISVPLVPIAIFLVYRRFRYLLPIAIYVSLIFMSTVNHQGVYLSLPLAIATPFVLRAPGAGKRGLLGPSSVTVARYSLVSLLAVFIYPQVSIPIVVVILSTFGYIFYSYVILSKSYTKILALSDTIPVDRKASVTIEVYTPIKSYVIIDHSFGSNIYVVKGRSIIHLEFPAKHTGRNVVDLSVYVFDGLGFAGRYIAKYFIEYKAIPMVQYIVEAVEKTFLEVQDIESFLSNVEVAVYSLDLGAIAVSMSGRKAVDIIREYIHRARAHPYALRIVERFASVLEELSHMVGRGDDVFRRSRWGEYMGVRYYTAGDSIKHIHWKKSISRGIMVVKEFGSTVYEKIYNVAEEGLEPIVITDLYASSVLDLDRIAFNLVKLCLDIFKRSPTTGCTVILVVGDIVISLRGRVVDILYRLYRTFKGLSIQTLFNYTSIHKVDEGYVEEILEIDKKPKIFSIYILSNTMYADKLAEVIIREGCIPPKPFTAIYSRSLELRYAIAKYILSRYGYIYTPLELVPEVVMRKK